MFFLLLLPFIVKTDAFVIRRLLETASAFAFALGVTPILRTLSAGWITRLEDKNILISAAVHTPLLISFAAAVLLLAVSFLFAGKDTDHTAVCRFVSAALVLLFAGLFVALGFATDWHFYGIADGWRKIRGTLLDIGFRTYFADLSVFEKLFGTGYNSFGRYTLTYFPYLVPAGFDTAYLAPHNVVLQTLFETGFFGFAGCISLYMGSIYVGLKNASETSVICFFAVAVYLVSMLFYVPSPEVTIPVILFLAGLSGTALRQREKPENRGGCAGSPT